MSKKQGAQSKEHRAKSTEQRAEELQKQIDQLTEALQRERADSENIRRRHDEQIAKLKDVVKANIIRELLPLIDNFERSLKHVPAELKDNDYVKGVSVIVSQFENTLKKLGVERIKTVGQEFDPRLHEAVSMEEGSGELEVVCEELQAGYVLGDEVLRHAMVKVRMMSKQEYGKRNTEKRETAK